MFASLGGITLARSAYLHNQCLRKCTTLSNRSFKITSKKKWGILLSTAIAVPGIWYLQTGKQQHRKVRVTVQGFGRFLRYFILAERTKSETSNNKLLFVKITCNRSNHIYRLLVVIKKYWWRFSRISAAIEESSSAYSWPDPSWLS